MPLSTITGQPRSPECPVADLVTRVIRAIRATRATRVLCENFLYVFKAPLTRRNRGASGRQTGVATRPARLSLRPGGRASPEQGPRARTELAAR
jgi:hypothetical protein